MFYVGCSLERAAALALPLAEQEAWVRATLLVLLPIYRFVVWSRDNDFVSMRQVLDKERTVKRQKGLHKNDKVRIVRGILTGKDGVVQEVEGKGLLKVLVGKMVIKIDAADVERPDA
jgi:transcription antitermination factor NusG